MAYGGIERVVWGLGKGLSQLGHNVCYLTDPGSKCSHATIVPYNSSLPINDQIPEECDVVHFHFTPREDISKPSIVTVHVNKAPAQFHINSVFVSKDHASRFSSDVFVHNGLDWSEYSTPDLENKRTHFHFLGNAAWRKKNVKGAIKIARKAGEKLVVVGGTRLNFKMGFRFTVSPQVTFKGMIGGEEKDKVLNTSKGLIFPVLWPEPFGLAIIESLYFGCPVFGTGFGALPELISNEVGFVSNSMNELVRAVKEAAGYDGKICHEYASECFSAKKMAADYVNLYFRVLNGEKLNSTLPYPKYPPNKKLFSVNK